MSKHAKRCKPWERFGTPDELRQLQGYSAATAKKPRPPKKKKPKLRLVKGGKR